MTAVRWRTNETHFSGTLRVGTLVDDDTGITVHAYLFGEEHRIPGLTSVQAYSTLELKAQHEWRAARGDYRSGPRAQVKKHRILPPFSNAATVEEAMRFIIKRAAMRVPPRKRRGR